MTARKSKIEELIDLANLIPPDCELPAIDEGLGEVFRELDHDPTATQETWLQRVNEVLRLALKGLPKEFRRYVLESDSDAPLNRVDQLEDAIDNYKFVGETRRKLRAFAHLAQMEPYRRMLFIPVTPLEVKGRIRLDPKGNVQIIEDALGQALRENVNVNQIRECAHCNKIFWAKRKDQICCAPNCAAAYRAVTYRARSSGDSERYKERRRVRQQKRRSQ